MVKRLIVLRKTLIYFGAILSGCLPQNMAKAKAESKCQMPHQAAIIAIPPIPPKKLKIKMSASPEFWMPVSIEMARAS